MMPLDVSDNGIVEPLDALLIINHLNETGLGELPIPDPAEPPELR